jgi:hypothetical protein
MLGKDALDGGAIDLVPQVPERVAQAGIAPTGILARDFHDELLN